jgi:hypothetical protein
MHKPTSVKNQQANAILECIHAVFTNMLCTAEIDMADLVKLSDINNFLSDTAWDIRSIYHTVLKASPGAELFGQDKPIGPTARKLVKGHLLYHL